VERKGAEGAHDHSATFSKGTRVYGSGNDGGGGDGGGGVVDGCYTTKWYIS